MSVTFLARMKIHPEKEAEYVSLCKQLEEMVSEHEKDTLAYKFYRLKDRYHYAVLESFTSHEADEAHQQTPYFKDIAPKLIACLDGPYVREYLYDIESCENHDQ